MHNSLFFALLRLIFGLKTKIAPPLKAIGERLGEEAEMMWTRRSGSQPARRPPLFLDHLILTEKPLQSDSRLMKIWAKFVYCCFKFPKKPPPLLCEILAARLVVQTVVIRVREKKSNGSYKYCKGTLR